VGDPVVGLEPEAVAVEPGGQARVRVSIRNEGTIVEGYRVEVLDDVTGIEPGREGPAQWSETIPAEGEETGGEHDGVVTVYPGQQQSVAVVFSPPLGTRAPGGHCAFGVKVTSVVDPDCSTVVEGDLEVGKVTALQARIVPVTSAGRWSGRHVVQLSNGGNVQTRLRVVAEDPDRALGFMVHPETVELAVGASQPVRLKVRTRRPRLRGVTTRLPFTVHAAPADLPPATASPTPSPVPGQPAATTAVVDAAFTQKPILSLAALLSAALLLLAVVGAAAYGISQQPPAPKTFEEQGPPGTPEVSVEATGPHSVRVSWVPLQDIEGYRLLRLDAEGVSVGTEDVDAGLGALPVEDLQAGQEHCFVMQAVRGEASSPLSDPACATTDDEAVVATAESVPTERAEGTDESPATGAQETAEEETGAEPTTVPPVPEPETPSPTAPETDEETDPTATGPATGDLPGFVPGQWAAVVGTFPADGSTGEFGATERADALAERGVAAVVIDVTEFPDLGLTGQGWLVVLEDGFDTREAAFGACQETMSAAPDLVAFCNPPVVPVSQ
jgi:hypothetical protein